MNPKKLASNHIPVMSEEVIKSLDVQPGGRYIDCTLGGGGHAAAILEHSSPGGQLLGIDADPKAIEAARIRLEPHRNSSLLINGNFADLQTICIKNDFSPVHGILLDLGLSSLQLNANGRGFSFQHNSPLDMRFDPNQKTSAADIINTSSETELASLLKNYGEEGFSRQIARRIIETRPMETSRQLARVIEKVVGRRRRKIHPATRTFQALRITVNRELENLKAVLKQAVNLLGFEGRLVVISYHSLEDRIVKQFMQQESRNCICPPDIPSCVCGHKAQLKLINKRVITPSEAEVKFNPRSRSSKLRASERIIAQGEYDTSGIDPSILITNATIGWRRPTLLRKIKMAYITA